MPDLKLSVVLPNYNDAEFLDGALKAICEQSRRPDEVLVIDDGSTDDSPALLERLAAADPVIRVIPNERNRGVNYSLNRGLELASGDFVHMASADDRLRPGHFEKSMRLLAEHPQAGVSCTDPAFLAAERGEVYEDRFQMGETARYFSPEEFRGLLRRKRTLSIGTNTCLWRRDALLAAGGLLPELRWHADWLTAHVLALRHGLCYVPEALAVFRVVEDSYSYAGMRGWRSQSEVVRAIFRELSKPAYDDVRDGFRIPGLISRFGVRMLLHFAPRPRYWRYFSPRLVPYALRCDWDAYEVKRRIYWSMPVPVRRVLSAAAAWRRGGAAGKAGSA